MLDKVLQSVKPTESDRRKMERVVEEILNRVGKRAEEMGIQVTPLLVGSASRGTWIRTERELDVFLLFPPTLSRESLENQGMKLARAVAGPGGKEQYAEHPYLTVVLEGFKIDLVPCFDIEDPGKIKSAVDRTPHHHRYLSSKLTPELKDQVLLVKQFLKGIGVYGAEARVQGFSGYLSELLTLHYGSFQKLVESASRWKPGVVIDTEKQYPNDIEPRTLFEKQPLIVIDPVDPRRNVAAAVSTRSFSTFVLACRDYLQEPRPEFFFPKPPPRLTGEVFTKNLRRRGTKLCCLVVQHPGLPEDVVFPQLRKTERALSNEMVQAGFEILRTAIWADERSAAILVELSISRLPPIQTRPGPQLPLDVSSFIDEHLKSPRRISGPSIDDAGRVVFELRRLETDGVKVIRRVVERHRGFGKHIGEGIERKEYRVLVGAEIVELLRNPSFRDFMAQYLENKLPWYR